MSRYRPHSFEIPEETIRVAQEAFPKGNAYTTMRDTLGPLFNDADFAPLFDWRGQEGVSPGLLSMVTIMQYMEGLTDRQTAEAVRGRIDWKYVLGLPLTHRGFHYRGCELLSLRMNGKQVKCQYAVREGERESIISTTQPNNGLERTREASRIHMTGISHGRSTRDC